MLACLWCLLAEKGALSLSNKLATDVWTPTTCKQPDLLDENILAQLFRDIKLENFGKIVDQRSLGSTTVLSPGATGIVADLQLTTITDGV